jgi:hypothetical protein
MEIHNVTNPTDAVQQGHAAHALRTATGAERLIGRHSSILVDPFSLLHHQCAAWILSGWSSLHAPPIPLGFLWSGTTSP